jgi:hypothetical protein
MPKVYDDCVRNRINDGESKKTAQRRCAIWFIKKFGKHPSKAEMEEFSTEEKELFGTLMKFYEIISEFKEN